MGAIAHYLCIGCPLGCQLEVEAEGKEILAIRGFACRRGREFAVREHTDPRRMVTTTVQVRGGDLPRVPVKTKEPIPKYEATRLCEELHKISLHAPVRHGEVVLADALGFGVDVVATRDVALGEGVVRIAEYAGARSSSPKV